MSSLFQQEIIMSDFPRGGWNAIYEFLFGSA